FDFRCFLAHKGLNIPYVSTAYNDANAMPVVVLNLLSLPAGVSSFLGNFRGVWLGKVSQLSRVRPSHLLFYRQLGPDDFCQTVPVPIRVALCHHFLLLANPQNSLATNWRLEMFQRERNNKVGSGPAPISQPRRASLPARDQEYLGQPETHPLAFAEVSGSS